LAAGAGVPVGYGLVTATLMLPVFARSGSTTIVYVLLVGRVRVVRLKLDQGAYTLVNCVPSGFNSRTVTQPNVLDVSRTVICWPAVPVNVKIPFCPGLLSGTDTAGWPIAVTPAVSAGTSYSVSVTLPTAHCAGDDYRVCSRCCERHGVDEAAALHAGGGDENSAVGLQDAHVHIACE
jgi:hypothetical protein